jgi:hypothetical protein
MEQGKAQQSEKEARSQTIRTRKVSDASTDVACASSPIALTHKLQRRYWELSPERQQQSLNDMQNAPLWHLFPSIIDH